MLSWLEKKIKSGELTIEKIAEITGYSQDYIRLCFDLHRNVPLILNPVREYFEETDEGLPNSIRDELKKLAENED